MAACTETRERMKTYWKGHSKPSLEMMMLDNNAASIADQETREILDMLPPFRGLDVVELGAGIGRFTKHLALLAGSLHASDFMEEFIDKNREENGHFANLTLAVADATQMTLPAESYDLVFSNWLFMYLDDAEVLGVFSRILDWLRPGGYFFFRESCFHRSGSVKRSDNPTQYRSPQRYNELLLEAAHGERRFGHVYARPSRTYVAEKGNRNQMCWLVRKTEHLAAPEELEQLREAQRLLSDDGIARLEEASAMGGEDDTVGEAETLCKRLGVKPGEAVLDVGCGLGETSCLLAEKYGANVIGLDISGPLVSLALQRANEKGVRNVIFEVADIETYDLYDDGLFDLIYSRDVMQYINDKEVVLAKFFKWLKPGGRLFLTDYCVTGGGRGREIPGDHIVSLCGPHPSPLPTMSPSASASSLPMSASTSSLQALSRDAYADALRDCGFDELATEDLTPNFEEAALAKTRALAQARQVFIQHFGISRFEQAHDNWQRRLEMCQKGELAWILYHVIKPEKQG